MSIWTSKLHHDNEIGEILCLNLELRVVLYHIFVVILCVIINRSVALFDCILKQVLFLWICMVSCFYSNKYILLHKCKAKTVIGLEKIQHWQIVHRYNLIKCKYLHFIKTDDFELWISGTYCQGTVPDPLFVLLLENRLYVYTNITNNKRTSFLNYAITQNLSWLVFLVQKGHNQSKVSIHQRSRP